MTHKFTKTLLRGMALTALAGIGLVATPGTARADFITFTVNEGAVSGTPEGPDFQADLLNGGYSAALNLAPSGGACQAGFTGCGSWSEVSSAKFSQYFLGANVIDGFIGDNETNGYLIIGTLNSAGTYLSATCPDNALRTCYYFTFTSQTGTLSLDTNSDETGDVTLLTASGVGEGTEGTLRVVTATNVPVTGSFNSNFLVNTLAANGTAASYWPTLATLQFSTVINGDLNAGSTLSLLRGDVSVQFQNTAVPEPATLTLLSLGLAAGARSIRRRRAVKA